MPIISTTLMKLVSSLKGMLPKLTQETKNLNNPICIKEIELSKTFLKRQLQTHIVSLKNSVKHLRRK